MRIVLIYLFSHSFLCKFGDVAEVGNWSIVLESVSIKISFFSKGVTCAVLKQDEKLLPSRLSFTIYVIGVKSTLIQSRTSDVGIGSKSHDLFGVDLMILRTSSSHMVWKETNLFLFSNFVYKILAESVG